MGRKTTVLGHLNEEEIKNKIKNSRGHWEVQKWLVIWNAYTEPRSAEEIAKHTGLAVDTVQQTVSRYNKKGPDGLIGPGKGGRRNCYLSLAEEKAFVERFKVKAEKGELSTTAEIKQAYEELVGEKVVTTTIYRLLSRHKWRKVMPRSYHPQGSEEKQEAFKKTFHT